MSFIIHELTRRRRRILSGQRPALRVIRTVEEPRLPLPGRRRDSAGVAVLACVALLGAAVLLAWWVR